MAPEDLDDQKLHQKESLQAANDKTSVVIELCA